MNYELLDRRNVKFMNKFKDCFFFFEKNNTINKPLRKKRRDKKEKFKKVLE